MPLFRSFILALTSCMLTCNPTSAANAEKVNITITDQMAFHVHPVGKPIKLSLLATSPTDDPSLSYQWVDHNGQPISQKAAFSLNKKTKIASPPLPAGYFGLQISADNVAIEDRIPGEKMEYGFSVQTNTEFQKERAGINGQFGIVHVELEDPYIPSWIKTMTWQTASPGWWPHEMEKRHELGLYELPIILGEEWQTDDRKPITSQQLDQLGENIKRYFAADRSILFWELGLEENLSGRYHHQFYWDNLAAKTRRIRKEADLLNPDIKLIYQVESLKPKVSQNFFKSEAAKYFDILSLHPYKWPDFPMPETWLAKGLQIIRTDMTRHGKTFPIWFTEVGAPHHGNHPSRFFGYPQDNKKVDGLSRANAVSYLIQLHAIAFTHGVEKIFWYNYADQFDSREEAEANFGLVDYKGYPKPVYTAYNNLHSLLQRKEAIPARQPALQSLGMQVYSFKGDKQTVDVIWSKSGQEKELDTTTIKRQPQRIITAMGNEVVYAGQTLKVGKEPVYFIYLKEES